MAASNSSVSFGDNLSGLTKLKLTEELRKRNVKTAGTKDILIARLRNVLKKEMEEMQAQEKELLEPELELERLIPDNTEMMEAMETSKVEEDPLLPKSSFMSSDYENIDSAQGSPDAGYEDPAQPDQTESFKSPEDALEPITPQKDFEDVNESLFEQIDSMSETGDPELIAQEVTYEILSDRDSTVDYKDFSPRGIEEVEQDDLTYEGQEIDYLAGEQLPYEGDDLLYEDEPLDPELELIDSQGEDQPSDIPAESKSEQFQIEGQEPISPCESPEEYPVVHQDSGEKSEPKCLQQSNEDDIVLDVGGENLELENVSRKEKIDKSKELKKQDPKCNLWISNLPEITRASVLKNKFSAHGNVISAKIVANASKSGEKNKFFGYVIMSTPEEASTCIEQLNDSEIDGNQVTVEIAKTTLPNVVSRPSSDRGSRDLSDRGNYRSDRREDMSNRRIVLVRGGSGQKLVRIRDSHHSGESRTHFPSSRQVREVRDVRGNRSASPRDRRIALERRNRYSPPPSYRGIHSAEPYRRRVVNREFPIPSRGLETKSYSTYRGRGDSHMRSESNFGRGFYSPRLHHSMGGIHTTRSYDPAGMDKSRREEDKRRIAEEIHRHEKLENEIRKREQREKERLMKQMHERETARDKEFRERERLLHERENSEREKRIMLEEALRSTEKRERELLKEKEMQNMALQESERKLAKREKDAHNFSQLQQDIVLLEKKQKEEKHNLEQKLREYQNREKRIEIEQQERQKMESRERMDDSAEQDRRMKESKGMKRYEEIPMQRQQIKRTFDEPKREYGEKRIREEPHSMFYSSVDSENQRWRGSDKPKTSGPGHDFRGESYPTSKRGSHLQQSSHSTGHSGRYTKQPEEYFDHSDTGHQSYTSHVNTRPYSSRGGHSYRGRNYVPRSSDSQRTIVHSSHARDRDSYDSSKKMREHTPSPTHERYYTRSDRHSMSGHKSQSDSRNISRPGPSSSSMRGRHSDNYGEKHSSNKSMHRESSSQGIGGDWQGRSYSATTSQTGYSDQRLQSFEKIPRPPMPAFGIPPTPVLPGAPGGFMGSLGHPAATAALLTSLSLQHAGMRSQAPFQQFPPNFRQ